MEAEGPAPFMVAVVGKRPWFHQAVATALRDLAGDSGRRLDCGEVPVREGSFDEPAYGQVLARSRRFLDAVLPGAAFRLVRADSLTDLGHALGRLPQLPDGERPVLALVLIDAAAAGVSAAPLDRELDAALEQLRSDVAGAAAFEPSGYSVVVYEAAGPDTVHVASPFTHRVLPEQAWVLAGDAVCCLTDVLQLRQGAAALRAASRTTASALAAALAGFLDGEARGSWGLHYYTGSAVSGLIGDLEELAAASGSPVLRGPSEHSLACGALARWQVDGAPALIVATSGMVDEFRGTLANLREARARGFIVCADSPSGAWFPFQGTVHAAEDSREVLRARRLPCFYLDDPARLADDLAAAFAAYGEDRGPVVLLATPEVLRVPAPAGQQQPEPARAPLMEVTEDALAPVMDLVNDGPAHVLWQCGALDAEQRGLVYDIAAEAGIALADSLTRPGTVAGHHEGRRVEEYLGTLGMYGYSARVHAFLHEGSRLRHRDRQALFFLNSRIPEAATPFAPRTLKRMLRIVQVTREAAHLAPFTDHPVHADGTAFLRAVRQRLAVPEELRAARRAAIAATADSPSDVVHLLPVAPMSPNYFFHRLAAVLDDLITAHGYTYTGVFDVGRGGLSAIRNLPRTGPGFSGWYGRALMGDALMAVPALALTRQDNVLAFVGDGAAALVPDMVPTLVEHICLDGRRPAGNVSVFRLVDGGHSVIRTYREGRAGAASARQTRVLHLLDDEREQSFGPVTVSRRRLTDVDGDALRDQLTRPSTVNLYDVLLAHNNEGDGLSLLSSLGWQRDELSDLALAMGPRPRPAAARTTPRPGSTR